MIDILADIQDRNKDHKHRLSDVPFICIEFLPQHKPDIKDWSPKKMHKCPCYTHTSKSPYPCHLCLHPGHAYFNQNHMKNIIITTVFIINNYTKYSTTVTTCSHKSNNKNKKNNRSQCSLTGFKKHCHTGSYNIQITLFWVWDGLSQSWNSVMKLLTV